MEVLCVSVVFETPAKGMLGSVLMRIEVQIFFLSACFHASPNHSTCLKILLSEIHSSNQREMVQFAHFNSAGVRGHQSQGNATSALHCKTPLTSVTIHTFANRYK